VVFHFMIQRYFSPWLANGSWFYHIPGIWHLIYDTNKDSFFQNILRSLPPSTCFVEHFPCCALSVWQSFPDPLAKSEQPYYMANTHKQIIYNHPISAHLH
jgi:hypothetical protein